MYTFLKRVKPAIVIAIALASALMASTAWAYRGHGYGHHHHGGARVGLYIGGPVLGFSSYGYPAYGYGYGYGYGYAPYGYYGPATTVIMTPAAPTVYIEQSSAADSNGGASPTGPASDGYWYYCSNPDGYYPYVKQCANGWQKVPPQPINR